MKHLTELSAATILSCTLLFLQCSKINANQIYFSIQGGEGDMITGKSNFNYVDKKTGGFAYRIAFGYLFNITTKLQIGPELGYLEPGRKWHYFQRSIIFS